MRPSRRSLPHHIIRIDRAASHTHSWFVTVQRRGQKWRKHFSDGVSGGKKRALQAALAYRDKLIAKSPPLTRREYASIRRKNNVSGIPGVCRYARRDKKDGRLVTRWFWAGFWAIAPGKSRQAKFSVDKYGEEEAFRRAKRARLKALAALQGPWKPDHTSSR